MQLIKTGSNYDFVGKRKIAALVSGALVLLSLLFFVFHGPSWGIDFTGGSEIHLKFEKPIEIGQVRKAVASIGLGDDAVQQLGEQEEGEYVIRIQDATFGSQDMLKQVQDKLKASFGADWIQDTTFDAEIGARMTVHYTGEPKALGEIQQALTGVDGADVQAALDDNTFYVKLPGIATKVQDALRGSLADAPFKVLQVDSVGPKVGGDLRRQGFLSIGVSLLLVLLYVGFRFDLSFAPGAVIALFHDVTIVIGVFMMLEYFGLFAHEFNLPMIGALLTIVGYSLNDTIIIYDRIRENMRKYRRRDTARLINDAVNETLGRTLGTSLTTILAMVPFLVLGGPVIKTFALAIILGVFVGTYSTVYVASPTILLMEDLQPYLSKYLAPATTARAIEEKPEEALTQSERRRKERSAKRGEALGTERKG